MLITVNGPPHTYDGDPLQPLLWYLRDELGLTGTKFGCGISACGACTVHVGGTAIHSCVTPMKSVADKQVQKAWAEANLPQCGYCQSGQMMTAAALLEKTPKPTEADIDHAMSPVICRCGTYSRIRAAIVAASAGGR